jgi:large subunit ribosomal protein L19
MSAPHPIISAIEKQYDREQPLPSFRPGDTVKVWVKIREGDKTRLQAFEGVCIRRSHGGARASFTVRKMSYGVGVERMFPVGSPNVDRVEVTAEGRVRRSRLYYLRARAGKAARIRERSGDRRVDEVAGLRAAPESAATEEAAVATEPTPAGDATTA